LSFGMDAHSWSSMPLDSIAMLILIVDCSRPHQTSITRCSSMLQISAWYIDTMLHDNSDLLIDWVYIWHIWMPQVWRNKVLVQKVNGFTCTMLTVYCDVHVFCEQTSCVPTAGCSRHGMSLPVCNNPTSQTFIAGHGS